MTQRPEDGLRLPRDPCAPVDERAEDIEEKGLHPAYGHGNPSVEHNPTTVVVIRDRLMYRRSCRSCPIESAPPAGGKRRPGAPQLRGGGLPGGRSRSWPLGALPEGFGSSPVRSCSGRSSGWGWRGSSLPIEALLGRVASILTRGPALRRQRTEQRVVGQSAPSRASDPMDERALQMLAAVSPANGSGGALCRRRIRSAVRQTASKVTV